MDARFSEIVDLPALARERVAIGPVPAWISTCPYDGEFKAQLRGAVTYLLQEFQADAESRQSYHRTALRLETMHAVQQNSQWRLELEPQTQSITLHSIKIRRGAVETEHASLARMQFLQRESDLEGHTIDGWITLLLLLEDVQPGDVLECSYTVASHPRLLAQHTALLFSLPPGVEIGKYHFSVRHAATRPLKWKSSAPELSPTITTEDAQVRWVWEGEKFCSPEPEPLTPDWCLDFPWIQVSDCADWQLIARSFWENWKEDLAGEGLGKLIAEVKEAGADRLAQVRAAVELVQDRFRYLSVNVELGGQIPAAAEKVIRRRYGDCKDVSFLLVQLLHGLGITARPVLVNVNMRQALTKLLPSPLFNHVVVEYEVEQEKRWVDVTAKSQGGGALQRPIANFGLGLLVAENTTDLAPVPAASLVAASIEVKETLLLDTSGKPSCLALTVTARGAYAEAFRFEFENSGFDVVAKGRLQLCANRYFRAARVGPLQTRDDRELNEFVLAEVFEIEGFLRQDDSRDTCLFPIQSEAASQLICPSEAPRRNPFALPFPCQRVHIIEIEGAGVPSLSIPHYQADAEFFSFSRRCKSLPKFLRLTFSFNTLAESVPAAKVPAHRRVVEEVWRATAMQIRLAVGYARQRQRGDFGALPPPMRTGAGVVRTGLPKEPPVTVGAPPAVGRLSDSRSSADDGSGKKLPFVDPVEAATRRRHSSRSSAGRSARELFEARGRRTNRKSVNSLLILLGVIVALIVAAILMRDRRFIRFSDIIFLSVIPAWIWSMVLGVLGLRQCLKHPERYPTGKTVAMLSLVFGGFIGLLLAIGLVGELRAALAGNTAVNRFAFQDFNFIFRAESHWKLFDKRMALHGMALGFGNIDSPMVLNVTAQALEPGVLEPRKHVIELSRDAYQREATSYRWLSEGEMVRNGLPGWQAETQGTVQGRDTYHVRWVLATNGFGYQLMVFGPMASAAKIKEEAERLFDSFELTQPAR